MSPIQTGCAETPMSTNTMPARSISDRGLIAEMMPTGNESSSQKTAPPNTSEAVTGRRGEHDVVHVAPVDERLAERLVDDELLEEEPVLLPQRVVQVQLVRDLLAPAPASRPVRPRGAPDRPA